MCKIFHYVSFSIPPIDCYVSLVLYYFSAYPVLINILVFSKNHFLVLLGLYNVCLFSVLIIWGFIFIICFPLFSLDVISQVT